MQSEKKIKANEGHRFTFGFYILPSQKGSFKSMQIVSLCLSHIQAGLSSGSHSAPPDSQKRAAAPPGGRTEWSRRPRAPWWTLTGVGRLMLAPPIRDTATQLLERVYAGNRGES